MVKYLGHVISAAGVETDPDKVIAVKDWPVPKNARELQSFIGTEGYYRRYIKDFSKRAAPLHALVSTDPNHVKKYRPGRKWVKSPPIDGKWDLECQLAFDDLK